MKTPIRARRPEPGRAPEPAPQSHAGLCASCLSAPECTFPRASGRPVLECEEFNGFSSVLSGRVSKKNLRLAGPPALRGNPGHPTENSSSAKGLCTLCENLRTCTYPRPEGGVWHCEDYL
jgi:hypothetical protein